MFFCKVLFLGVVLALNRVFCLPSNLDEIIDYHNSGEPSITANCTQNGYQSFTWSLGPFEEGYEMFSASMKSFDVVKPGYRECYSTPLDEDFILNFVHFRSCYDVGTSNLWLKIYPEGTVKLVYENKLATKIGYEYNAFRRSRSGNFTYPEYLVPDSCDIE